MTSHSEIAYTIGREKKLRKILDGIQSMRFWKNLRCQRESELETNEIKEKQKSKITRTFRLDW